jgi:flagella basal body P-ring formation protein FlgA
MAAAVVLTLLAGLAAGGWCAEITSVRVYERTEIQEDQILLGRVARIDGGDAKRVSELAAVELGRAPLPGRSRTLERSTLLLRLKQSGIDPEGIDLQAPAEIEISRGAVTVGREQMEQIVRDFIRRQVPDDPSALRIKDIRVPDPVVLPAGHLTTSVLAPRNTELSGIVPLTVVLKVGEDAERRVGVTVNLERLVTVVVTRRPLGRYKPIEDDDIELKPMDLADLPADRITDPEAVVGKRTRRALDSGAVLRPDLVELPPLVKRGDRVRIIAEADGLRISAAGQVKQKGCLGEIVPVANLDSNKVVHARVVDSQTVRIEF